MCSGEMEGVCVMVRWRVCVCSGEMEGVCVEMYI